MLKSLVFLSSGLVLASLVGCAAEEDATVQDVSATSAKAKVRKKQTDKVEQACVVSGTELEVFEIAVAAATRINETLTKNRTKAFESRDCSVPFEFVSSMEVKHFAGGYLSVESRMRSYQQGDVRPGQLVEGHNFILANGSSLGIKDLVTSAGISKAVGLCDAAMQKAAHDLDEDDGDAGVREASGDVIGSYEQRCRSALKAKGETANFTFDESGIRIHPNVGVGNFFLEAAGALIPWSAIADDLTPTGRDVFDSTK